MILSIIICTHNPIADNLKRTLSALKLQSLNQELWELIIIDNASKAPISNLIDVKWHKRARILQEPICGLMRARIKGIQEAVGELIVFVDDDNCLKTNYLETIVRLMQTMPILGVVGAGKIIPEFEVEPSLEVKPFLRSLAIRNEVRSYFSNEIKYSKAIPFGAGLCIRRSIALQYVIDSPLRPFAITLDRNGESLQSGGDIDLAIYVCKQGYLSGVSNDLELTHIIPKFRLEHKYLIKIAAGHAYSNYILTQIWGLVEYPSNPIIIIGRFWRKWLFNKGLSRKIVIAEYKAEKKAKKGWLIGFENSITSKNIKMKTNLKNENLFYKSYRFKLGK